MPNSVKQWQIVSTDPEAHAAFYGNLFGWDIDDANAMNYRRVKTDDGEFQGGFWPSPSNTSLVQLYIEVADVPASVETAVGLGAKVLVPPQVLPDGDQMALLVDPVGLSFGVFKSAQ